MKNCTKSQNLSQCCLIHRYFRISVGMKRAVFTALMVSGYNYRDITLEFDNIYPDSLKDNYYEPILEAEPYTFTSISYLAYELPFNKNRYYETMELVLRQNFIVNCAIKLSVAF